MRPSFFKGCPDPTYTLFRAYTGREALEVVKQKEIHLILLDIMMPEMDGLTAMAKIREISNVPIILLTTKSEDAATGNLEVALVPCEVETFLTQTAGEYEQKVQQAVKAGIFLYLCSCKQSVLRFSFSFYRWRWPVCGFPLP